jgi:hypothetical protein
MGGSEGEHSLAQQRINAVVQDGKASAAPTLGGFRAEFRGGFGLCFFGDRCLAFAHAC